VIPDSTKGCDEIIFVGHDVFKRKGDPQVEDSNEDSQECSLIENLSAVILEGDVFIESTGVSGTKESRGVVYLSSFGFSGFLTDCPTDGC
jgi:hypothetical protein